MLIYGEDEYVAEWTAARIPHADGFGPYAAIGVTIGEKLVAGWVYHDYQPKAETMQLSVASDTPVWARPNVLAELLSYPFRQMGCFKVYTVTPHRNERTLKANARIGFKKEAVLAHHLGKKNHAVICRMLRPDFEHIYNRELGNGTFF